MQRATQIACRKRHARKLPPPCGKGWGGGLRIFEITRIATCTTQNENYFFAPNGLVPGANVRF